MLSGSLIVLLNRRLVDFDTLGLNDSADALLEDSEVLRRQGIGLRNDGDKVDTGRESLHDLNVERLEGMAGGPDEVETGMYTQVNFVGTAGLLFLKHVGLMLVVDELDNGHPRIAVIHVVSEAGSIDDGQANYSSSVRYSDS